MLSTNSAEEDDEFDFAAYSPPGPYFDKEFSRNVTALVGKTASLSCKVLNAGNRTVSFARNFINCFDSSQYTISLVLHVRNLRITNCNSFGDIRSYIS